jgi:hypothetical protein
MTASQCPIKSPTAFDFSRPNKHEFQDVVPRKRCPSS